MEIHYKLHRLKELADNDQEFLLALASTFIEEVPEDARVLKLAVEDKNYLQTYQTAHKMKPTVDMFELGVLDDLIESERMWGIDAGLAWKEVADLQVFYIDFGMSNGMKYAEKYAKEHNIDIEYRKIY